MKTALITGISGQDGGYLAEHLLGLGHQVQGVVRREQETRAGDTRGNHSQWPLTNIEKTHASPGVDPPDSASGLLVPPEGVTMLAEVEDPRR